MTKMKPLELIVQKSSYSVSVTIEKLENAMTAKEMAIFAVVDHSGEAQKVHMNLSEEKVIIFGNPKVGTFLMQENPLIGMELPLRILVWQNEKKVTQVAYIDPLSLAESYQIIKNIEVLRAMSAGLAVIVAEAVK